MYGVDIDLTSGGCAALFLPQNHPRYDEFSDPVIKDIKFEHSEKSAKLRGYYPSNGMQEIYRRLRAGGKSFSLVRPNHHLVTITGHEN